MGVFIVKNATRALHSLYLIYWHAWMKWEHSLVWLEGHDRPPIGVDMIVLGALSTVLGQILYQSIVSVAIVKRQWEPNIVSTLYVDMIQSSGNIIWLDMRSLQAAKRCRHMLVFWALSTLLGQIPVHCVCCHCENVMRAQCRLYIICRHDSKKWKHSLTWLEVMTGRQKV